jgi:AcrR family transcriptional regulator
MRTKRDLSHIEEEIILATFRVAGRSRPNRFSTKVIAQELGISEALIYSRFQSKENLIAKTDEWLAARWYEILIEDVNRGASYEELVNHYFDYFLLHPDFVEFSLNYCRAFPQAVIPADFESFKKACHGTIDTIVAKHPFKEGADPFLAWCQFAREVNSASYLLISEGDSPKKRETIIRLMHNGISDFAQD